MRVSEQVWFGWSLVRTSCWLRSTMFYSLVRLVVVPVESLGRRPKKRSIGAGSQLASIRSRAGVPLSPSSSVWLALLKLVLNVYDALYIYKVYTKFCRPIPAVDCLYKVLQVQYHLRGRYIYKSNKVLPYNSGSRL